MLDKVAFTFLISDPIAYWAQEDLGLRSGRERPRYVGAGQALPIGRLAIGQEGYVANGLGT